MRTVLLSRDSKLVQDSVGTNCFDRTGIGGASSTETLEEKKGLTDRKDETIWKDVPVLVADTGNADSRSAYSDEKVVAICDRYRHQPVMPYETVRM